MPAEPAFNLTLDDITVGVGLTRPTVTVLTVPMAGGTRFVTWVAVVGV